MASVVLPTSQKEFCRETVAKPIWSTNCGTVYINSPQAGGRAAHMISIQQKLLRNHHGQSVSQSPSMCESRAGVQKGVTALANCDIKDLPQSHRKSLVYCLFCKPSCSYCSYIGIFVGRTFSFLLAAALALISHALGNFLCHFISLIISVELSTLSAPKISSTFKTPTGVESGRQWKVQIQVSPSTFLEANIFCRLSNFAELGPHLLHPALLSPEEVADYWPDRMTARDKKSFFYGAAAAAGRFALWVCEKAQRISACVARFPVKLCAAIIRKPCSESRGVAAATATVAAPPSRSSSAGAGQTDGFAEGKTLNANENEKGRGRATDLLVSSIVGARAPPLSGRSCSGGWMSLAS